MRTATLLVGIFLTTVTLMTATGCGSGDGGASDTTSTDAKKPDGEKDRQWAESIDPKKNQGKEARDRSHPVVKIETSQGDITVKLDGEKAMLTVDNFLEYVDQGHYDETILHQVNQGVAVLGGAYTKDMTEKAARVPIRNEAHNGLKNRRGTIAMARQPGAVDSATCQFFFNLADNPNLDHKDTTPDGYGYCVFGEVTQGMDVLDKIGDLEVHDVEVKDGPPLQNVPVAPVLIMSIRRAGK